MGDPQGSLFFMNIVTRLAPSPTGYLHLGNALSFLLCWLAARKNNGIVHLRIDDIDPRRSRREYAGAIIRDIAWLGLDWDGEKIFQSSRQSRYKSALSALKNQGAVYPCFCTRKELRSLAGAPHREDQGPPYPGTCATLDKKTQKKLIASGKAYSLRLRCPDAPIAFEDIIQGQQLFTRQEYGGDFPIVRSDGVWAYQLATAVDDAEMGVNFIMRGRDLLTSTPRQIVIAQKLKFPIPQYAHIPLLLDGNGERLAKRHKALSLALLREQGVRPERITGILAMLAGINPMGFALAPWQLLDNFALNMIPKSKISLAPKILALLHNK